MKFDELIELGTTATHRYYVGIEIDANTERVCNGLAIEDTGNTPHDECRRIVEARCRAIEGVLGFGATKPVSNFHKPAASEPAIAKADLIPDEDGGEGTLEWVLDKSTVPNDLLAKIEGAIDAGDQAAAVEIDAIEREAHDSVLAGLREAIEDEDEDAAQAWIDSGLLTDEEVAEADGLLADAD